MYKNFPVPSTAIAIGPGPVAKGEPAIGVSAPLNGSAPGQRLWTAQELAGDHVVRFLRANNRLGFNVYLWAYAERRNAGYIFLDLDHARPHVIEEMRIHGHEPCAVLETSPDCDAIVELRSP